MADIDALIADLEAATGPRRELDARIRVATGHPAHRDVASCLCCRCSPYYTASIDAALTLVPEGHAHGLSNLVVRRTPTLTGRPWSATVDLYSQLSDWRPAPKAPWAVGGDGVTGAIALCIAALRARKAIEAAP